MTGSLGLLSAFAESLGSSVNIAMALFTRLSLLMLLLPGLSGSVIPVRIRLILALTLLAMILPLVDVPEITDARLPAVLITEAAIGLSLGLAVRMLFFALSISGAIIAQALSLSQIFGTSMDGDSSSTISNALVMAGSALFLTADFEVAAIGMFVDNLTAVPVGAPGLFASGQTAEFLTRLASEAIAFGVMLALPFLVLNFATISCWAS